jgi:hypothetical protein
LKEASTLPLVGNPEARLKQLEVGKADAERRKEEKPLKAEAQKLQKAAAAQTAKELRAFAARPAAVKAEAEAKSDERLAVFMKWVESKLVELADSAKVAGRPAEELEEIVHLTGEAVKAQLQTDYFDPVSTAVNSIIDAFVELQTGVAHLSSSKAPRTRSSRHLTSGWTSSLHRSKAWQTWSGKRWSPWQRSWPRLLAPCRHSFRGTHVYVSPSVFRQTMSKPSCYRLSGF